MSPVLAAAGARVTMPVLYVTHGGGPMPLMGEPRQANVTKFLKNISSLLPVKPTAIVCVTGHWEEDVTTVSTSPAPPMLYDYYGFPPEAYEFKYRAPGSPELARRVAGLVKAAGLPCNEDSERGFDHGTFVPLILAFPAADVPVVQLSILHSMDPAAHIRVGQALQPLRDEGVLIIGSGSSFHNLRAWRPALMGGEKPPGQTIALAKAFDEYLNEACCAVSPEQRRKLLTNWEQAPGARLAQPREDHLVPLHVVVGAAGDDKGTAHRDAGMVFPCTHFLFGAVPPAVAA